MSSVIALAFAASLHASTAQAGTVGFYRFPALSASTIVFTAEGDLWTVGVEGGVARRLTAHHGQETHAAVSPDGQTVAFTAHYDGPREVYSMPIGGGVAVRRTFQDDRRSAVVGWTPDGQILYSTQHYSGLPSSQLVTVGLDGALPERVPLAEADQGVWIDADTLVFTRLAFQGSRTKRYVGGTAQNLWSWTAGEEAVPLTADFAGTSKEAMVHDGRVYFVSDRSGSMNLWSMQPDGSDPQQLTQHDAFDVASPSLSSGRIAYQHGADIHLYDIAKGETAVVDIQLQSDLEQSRERWIDSPMDWMSMASLSADGSRVALTARGAVFVAPTKDGRRLVQVTDDAGAVRWRAATFAGDDLVALGDATGENELWRLSTATPTVAPDQLTDAGGAYRVSPTPSPDGRLLAWADKDYNLFVRDLHTEKTRLVGTSPRGVPGDLRWSPDSVWLVYSSAGANQYSVLYAWSRYTGESLALTSDRYDSGAPAWSPDGKWLYFLSDRAFTSTVHSPWGPRAPEPHLDKETGVFALALVDGLRSPFLAPDELHPASADEGADPEEDDKKGKKKKKKGKKSKKGKTEAAERETSPVRITAEGLAERLTQLPLPSGNYSGLAVTKDRLFLTEHGEDKKHLLTAPIGHKDVEFDRVLEEIEGFDLSQDGEKLLVHKDSSLYVFEAGPSAPDDLSEAAVDLSGWRIRLDPRAERQQMFVDSWWLMREYFYDRGMHGVDWDAMLARHLPLVERVTDREELSDLMAQMVGELSALHIFVYGGDQRSGDEHVGQGFLGARFSRHEAGGFVVDHVYASDPERPDQASPVDRPDARLAQGDVVTHVNGALAADAPDMGALLRNQVGQPVRLRVERDGAPMDVLTEPISAHAEASLRYHEWEYSRRLQVEESSGGDVGYVHMRAMGGGDYSDWARDFYPVHDRAGLIIDMRHNRGGNIDSWIIEKLLRKAWFFWQGRSGEPVWNMQYAFRGHVVVLCDAKTASDGEAFTEGVKRLGIGHVIGTRTWGGEIWLSSSNRLVDRGIATAAEYGVYGPEGEWIIEGHGAEPDQVVDNPPAATFAGEDAQLEAALAYLRAKIAEEPVVVPPPPPMPDKSGQ
jgi:tricorn protease